VYGIAGRENEKVDPGALVVDHLFLAPVRFDAHFTDNRPSPLSLLSTAGFGDISGFAVK
jgi:hypothetical protein